MSSKEQVKTVTAEHPLRIVAAAVMFKGLVFTGARHGDCIRTIVQVGFATEEDKPLTEKNSAQGFIDINGFFRTRATSKMFAIESGQIKSDHKGMLYSEDLW